MKHTFTTYDAKARFSEVMRTVRAGNRVQITWHGRPIAEIVPIESEGSSLGERIVELERRGVLSEPGTPGPLRPLARRRGALKRFLAERE